MVLVERKKRIADNSVNDRGEDLHVPYVRGACPTALRQILRPHMALAVWQRTLGEDIVKELAGLVLDEVDDILFACDLSVLSADLSRAMEEAGYPDMPALRQDIAMLAVQHTSLTGGRQVRVRLEVVETDACRKFHADYVKVRTITTYLGQGTQWALAEAPDQIAASDNPAIRQLDAGEVGLFKGRLWQEVPVILHRSPPIGASGEQRLVLVIDPAPAEDQAAIRLGEACA